MSAPVKPNSEMPMTAIAFVFILSQIAKSIAFGGTAESRSPGFEDGPLGLRRVAMSTIIGDIAFTMLDRVVVIDLAQAEVALPDVSIHAAPWLHVLDGRSGQRSRSSVLTHFDSHTGTVSGDPSDHQRAIRFSLT